MRFPSLRTLVETIDNKVCSVDTDDEKGIIPALSNSNLLLAGAIFLTVACMAIKYAPPKEVISKTNYNTEDVSFDYSNK